MVVAERQTQASVTHQAANQIAPAAQPRLRPNRIPVPATAAMRGQKVWRTRTAVASSRSSNHRSQKGARVAGPSFADSVIASPLTPNG